MISAGGSEEVSHMDEKGIGVNVSFARTGTIRGRGRQMGQLAEERSHIGGESFGWEVREDKDEEKQVIYLLIYKEV